jgi:uncharacterized protein
MSFARLILPLILISAPLHAAEKSAAERLFEAVDMQGTGIATAKSAMKPMMDQFKAQGLPPKAMAEISSVIDLFFNKTFTDPELKKSLVKLYEQKFTNDELEEMLHFYDTPTGKKALLSMPEIMGEAGKIGQKLAGKNSAELQKQIQDIMAKYKDAKPEAAPKEDEK